MAQGRGFIYEVDEIVEVIGTEDGRLGSFYDATIMRQLPYSYYEVQHLMLDDDDGSRLIEKVPVGRLRPEPPHGYVQRFELGDEIDCLWRDGYWSGHIIGFDSEINAYYVEYPLTGDTRLESDGRLRPHFDWTGERFTCQPKFNYML